MFERKALQAEAEKTSSKVSEVVAALIIAGVSPHGITIGLLRVAAFIAKNTGCPPETFTKLADIAYRTISGEKADSGGQPGSKPGKDLN